MEEAAPVFDAGQEVRFAAVLYGGSSLAIYMYGIAEEFLRLVRSTAPAERVADRVGRPARVPGAREHRGGLPQARPAAAVRPGLDRRRPRAHALRRRRHLGHVGRRDQRGLPGQGARERHDARRAQAAVAERRRHGCSATTGARPTRTTRCSSSSTGCRRVRGEVGAQRRPHADAADHGVRRDGRAGARPVPPLVDELDLWVTATDLDGKKLPIQLSNGVVSERRFANRYHFRVAARDERNDFEHERQPVPRLRGAVHVGVPVRVRGDEAPAPAGLRERRPGRPELGALLPRLQARRVPRAPFSDGGILDNKPFSYATGSLVRRRAPLPVDRKLVYVEPDPSTGTGEPPPKAWNGLQTAQAAVLTLPRAENIRGDIQTVLTRNRTIERAREILSQATTDAPDRERIAGMLADEQDSATWAGLSLSDTIRQRNWGPAYASYHRLKVRGLVDYLASLVVRAKGLDPESDAFLAVHYLVRAWKDAHYAEQPAPGIASENQLLRDFSLPYRWRRLDYVLKRLRELHSDDADVVARALTGAGLPPELPSERGGEAVFLELRRGITLAEDDLYAADRALTVARRPRRPAEPGCGAGRVDHRDARRPRHAGARRGRARRSRRRCVRGGDVAGRRDDPCRLAELTREGRRAARRAGRRARSRSRDRPAFDAHVCPALLLRRLRVVRRDPLPARVRDAGRRDEPRRDPARQPARVQAARWASSRRRVRCAARRSATSGRSSSATGASTTCSGAASTPPSR